MAKESDLLSPIERPHEGINVTMRGAVDLSEPLASERKSCHDFLIKELILWGEDLSGVFSHFENHAARYSDERSEKISAFFEDTERLLKRLFPFLFFEEVIERPH